MPLQFNNIREDLFSKGIDARSAENQIAEGFVLDALNADIVQKHVRKRSGHAGFAGNLPVRATEVEYIYSATPSERQVCITLDSSIELTNVDLISVRSSPLVVHGRLSSISTGPFVPGTDNSRYYSGFTQRTRQLFNTINTPVTILGTEHGLGTPFLFAEVSQSASRSTLDNSLVDYDSLIIDTANNDLIINYQNGTGSNIDVFTYYLAKSGVTGSSYVGAGSGPTYVHSGTPASQSFVISAAQHQLSNFNIVARCYRDAGGTNVELIRPESLEINISTGDVTVTIENNTGVPQTYYAILSAAPTSNFREGSITGSQYTITITQPEKQFIFPGVYVRTGINTIEEVVPEEIEYDSTNDQLRITFLNPGASTFLLYWEYGEIRSTQLCVFDSSVTADGVDSAPQITLWGLDHSEIYGSTNTQRSGWTTHIDSYRTAGERRVIAGLGGNLYAAQTSAEAGTEYLFGSLLPSLFARVATSTVMAPPFWETGELPGRTRGYITGSGLGDNWVTVNAASWDSGVSAVRYDMTIPSLLMFTSSGSTETDINNIIGTTDEFTVVGMGYSRLNGTFPIVQVVRSGNNISIWCSSETVDSSDWNISGTAGRGGIFTDTVPFQSASPFLPGDTIISDAITPAFEITYVSTHSTNTSGTLAGIDSLLQIQTGVQLSGSRNSDVLPLRNASDINTVQNIVRGDILEYSETGIPLRVLSINPAATELIGLVGDGATTIATITTTNTDRIAAGNKLVLLDAGIYSGVIEVTEVLTESTFSFNSELNGTLSNVRLMGNTVHVGEAIDWQDSSADIYLFSVNRRFTPIEAPEDTYDLTQKTYTYHFDTESLGNQPFLRSTMVQDNLYLTNGQDEVMKFDGVNLYRAGLVNWQPGVFLSVDETATPIAANLRSVSYSATTQSGAEVSSEVELSRIPAGTRVSLSGSTELYTVRDTVSTTGPTAHTYLFDRVLDAGVAATGIISEVITYRYYYRLNAVDINNNIIASAYAQSEDYVVRLSANAGIRHKLVGMPAWDNYQYTAIYVQAYRTIADSNTARYKVYQQRVPFDQFNGYIEFTDSFRDINLTDTDPTAVLTGELGTGWQAPLRSKYLTSAGGTLVQSNIRGYPEVDFQIVGDSSLTSLFAATDTVLLRKDNTDISTTTDMVNRARYEWISPTSAVAVTGITGTVGVSFDVTIADTTGFAQGHWVYLYYSSTVSTNRNIKYSGWYQVSAVASGTVLTFKYSGAAAGAAAVFPDQLKTATNKFDIPVLLGDDGNLGQVNGNTAVPIFQAARRLALAINTTMRVLDTSIPSQEEYRPWVMARGGSDVATSGRVILHQPRVDEQTFSVQWNRNSASVYSAFANNLEVNSGQSSSATTALFPSRVVVGFPNYPEIQDSPTILDADQSRSAIDINPADGQEITGTVPFFGEAAFGAAQQSGVLAVFKENSIYLVDINEKRAGRNAVQRIETEGVGCTAPNSIAVTKNGIMFANESGLYALRRDMRVEFVGKYMDRNWKRVDRTRLNEVQGHHYTVGRQYKCAVPLLDGTTEVFTYDHTNEQELGIGAWSRYDNHLATGWCNLGQDAYFSTQLGRVMVLRRRGDQYDYQDDHSPIRFRLRLRPNDYGISGVRKVLQSVTINYRTAAAGNNEIGLAIDTEKEYDTTTPVLITTPVELSGLSSTIGRDIDIIQHSMRRRKGVSFSIQIENTERLQGVEIAGIETRVAVLGTGQGVIQAAQTNK